MPINYHVKSSTAPSNSAPSNKGTETTSHSITPSTASSIETFSALFFPPPASTPVEQPKITLDAIMRGINQLSTELSQLKTELAEVKPELVEVKTELADLKVGSAASNRKLDKVVEIITPFKKILKKTQMQVSRAVAMKEEAIGSFRTSK